MKIIDLTNGIHNKMPVFPGDEQPSFCSVGRIPKDGFAQTSINLYSHTGTHIDAPAHLLVEGKTLDQLGVEQFVGRAIIIDCTNLNKDYIEVKDLLLYEAGIREKEIEFILLQTGWSKYWGEEKYYRGFPFLTQEAARWLCDFGLKGIGIDALSIDEIKSTDFPIHHILFKNNILSIENLTNLDKVQQEGFVFSCLPLKYDNADGSPVRAVALEEV